MLDKIPSGKELSELIGENNYNVWEDICKMVDNLYDMEHIWNSGGKKWKYEYKYRRGGKTLCTLYARENCFGFMIILGKDERNKFEGSRKTYSKEVQQNYDDATTYHDGKWIMFKLNNITLLTDIANLLAIKRKPNKK